MAGESSQMLRFKYWYYYATHEKHRLDDDPIYIFDDGFYYRDKTKRLLDDYEVPSWFEEDHLSNVRKCNRPPHIWLIIGIPRSGSSLHVDPLGTHAWNTLISGEKRWVLFPPETEFSKEDKIPTGHIWFNKILPKQQNKKHYDFIQRRGETIFLPGGWWHITLVIKDSICITQNYINDSNHDNAKQIIMKERPKLYKYWMDSMGRSVPQNEVYLREDVYDSTDTESQTSGAHPS